MADTTGRWLTGAGAKSAPAWVVRGGRGVAAVALVALLATGCQPGDYSGGGGVPGGGVPGGSGQLPDPAATPEMGSLVLFGSGAAGMAGYAVARLRGVRRRR